MKPSPSERRRSPPANGPGRLLRVSRPPPVEMSMDLTASPIQQAVITASALLAAMIGVLGTLRRGHWVTTLVFSSAFLAVAALQAGVLGLLHADSAATARNWATYLLGVSALAGWLWLALSV